MDIGKAVKELRKSKGISQKELASLCGISANSMCSIEKGLSFPSKDTIDKICSSLALPVSYLLFFSISEEDVPAENRTAFNALKEPMKTILLSQIGTK